MAIKANTTYFVRRKGSSGNLGYLNIYGNSYTGDTQPIKLWEKVSSDPMQKWKFDANPESGAFLCTMCDPTRAINMYSTSTPNCTIWAKENNDTDGLVKIVEHASGYYYIRLVNRNLYLTATSSANGTQVTWVAQNPGSSTQLWEFVEEGSSGSSDSGAATIVVGRRPSNMNINGSCYMSSTNPFYASNPNLAGQCTWFAWGRMKEVTGKSINFSSSINRHAKNWPDLVTNCTMYPSPVERSVAVWDDGGSYGHVGFVEKINGSTIYITEANWPGDDTVSADDGVVKELTSTTIKARGLSSQFKIKCYLVPNS